jgi:phosphatidate cytidylyltransferase
MQLLFNNGRSMIGRIAYGALAIAIVFTLFATDESIARYGPPRLGSIGDLIVRGSVIPLACAVIACLASMELVALLRRTGVNPHGGFATIACVALALAPWFSAAGFLGAGPAAREGVKLQLSLAAATLLGAGLLQLRRTDVANGLRDLAGTWLVILYCGLLTGFLTLLRCDINVPGREGVWTLLVVLLVCKVSDIGAYFTGSFIGRHRLIPHVSPGKTFEGFLGGILSSALLSLLLLKLYNNTLENENPLQQAPLAEGYRLLFNDITMLYRNLTWMQAVIFGAVMSIVGQAGDLLESVFKRSAGAKDSARILPGFGGILDMIDSPLAAAPVAWFLLTYVWPAL